MSVVSRYICLAFVLIAFTMLAATLFRLQISQPTPDKNSAVLTPQSWQYPNKVKDQSPIARQHWGFDFTKAEWILHKLPRNKVGEIHFNNEASGLINSAIQTLNGPLSEVDLNRVRWLIEKSFPGNNGQQLALITLQYYNYLSARDSFQRSASDSQLQHAIKHHQQTMRLQQTIFGPAMAQQLFAERNHLRSHLLARQAIHTNLTLTTAQKQQRLLQLDDDFRQRQASLLTAL